MAQRKQVRIPKDALICGVMPSYLERIIYNVYAKSPNLGGPYIKPVGRPNYPKSFRAVLNKWIRIFSLLFGPNYPKAQQFFLFFPFYKTF